MDSLAEPHIVLASADDDVENWLKLRRTVLTATDMPSVLGVPGARSALETWYQKKDALVSRSESEAIRQAKQAGHDFEDSNAAMFARRAGRTVERSQRLIQSKKHTWLGCTLDYTQREPMLDRLVSGKSPIVDEARPLELKNAGSHAADDMWPLGGEPHLAWQMQVIVQCIVMQVATGSLSAWLGSPFVHHRWCDIERDTKLEEIILKEGSAFWKSLKRKTPPKDPDPKVAYEVLRRLAPARATHKIISLPSGAAEIHNRILMAEGVYEDQKSRADAAKAVLEAERGRMAALIGENAGGKLPGGTVWTFRHVNVPAHQVPSHSYRKLHRVNAQTAKPKRTTWKTSQ